MELNIINQIKKFQEYIEETKTEKGIPLKLKAQQSQHHLIIDFLDFIKFDPDFADELLTNPEETLKLFDKAVEHLLDESVGIKVRFKNVEVIPSNNIRIRDIRVKDYGRFVVVTGVVRFVSDIYGEITSIRYECPMCGNIMNVLQRRFSEIKEPTRCGCGRKGKFTKLDDEIIDSQRMVIEEEFESLGGNQQPNKIELVLEHGLTRQDIERFNTLGSRISATGIIQTRPRIVKGKVTNELEKYIEANYIKQLDEKYKEINISKEDEQLIREYAKRDDLIEVWANSFAPDIHGYTEVKKAIVLQLFGGVNSINQKTKKKNRGDSHILLIGDPSTGKTHLAKATESIALKYRYCQGVRSSKAGLTVTVTRDEKSNQFGIEAGAIVLANGGICVLDEFDKMSDEDREALHETMEQQTITVDKATIHTTFKTETSILACANWKDSRFNPNEEIYKQIDMPDSLISRFDAYFVFIDRADPEKDINIMRHILKSRTPELYKKILPEKETLSPEFMKKYLIYCKEFYPRISEELAEKIAKKYATIRSDMGKIGQDRISLTITSRQGEAMQRFSEASAKMHLRDVSEQDFNIAISLLEYSLKSVALDYETGKIDIDRIATGTSTRERNLLYEVRDKLSELTQKFESGNIPIEELMNNFPKEKEKEVDDILERMKRSGDLYEPRRGFIKIL